MATTDRVRVRLVHSAPPRLPLDWGVDQKRELLRRPADPTSLIALARRIEIGFFLAAAWGAAAFVIVKIARPFGALS